MTETRILLDATALFGESRNRGKGVYLRELLTALSRSGAGDVIVELFVCVPCDGSGPELPDDVRQLLTGFKLHIVAAAQRWSWPRPADDPVALFQADYIAVAINAIAPDMLVLTDPFAADTVMPALDGLAPSIRTAAIVYDLIPLVMPADYLQPDSAAQAHYHDCLDGLRRVDHLLAISHATRRDLEERLDIDPARVSVIGAGGVQWTPPGRSDLEGATQRLRAHYSLGDSFVLYVAGHDPRKNFADAVRILAALPPSRAETVLFIASSGMPAGERHRLEKLARDLGLSRKRLVVTGYLEPDDLEAAYAGAGCFLHPSRYEGFGLPVLEALARGTPVLSARTSSIPEILDDPAMLYEPDEISVAAEKLAALLNDPRGARLAAAAARGKAAHLTWENTAHALLDACRSLTAGDPVPAAGGADDMARLRQSAAACVAAHPATGPMVATMLASIDIDEPVRAGRASGPLYASARSATGLPVAELLRRRWFSMHPFLGVPDEMFLDCAFLAFAKRPPTAEEFSRFRRLRYSNSARVELVLYLSGLTGGNPSRARLVFRAVWRLIDRHKTALHRMRGALGQIGRK